VGRRCPRAHWEIRKMSFLSVRNKGCRESREFCTERRGGTSNKERKTPKKEKLRKTNTTAKPSIGRFRLRLNGETEKGRSQARKNPRDKKKSEQIRDAAKNQKGRGRLVRSLSKTT